MKYEGRLECSRPGCMAHVFGKGENGNAARRATTLQAESEGWQIAPFGVDLAFCAEHHEPTAAMECTRLYDEHRMPLDPRFPREGNGPIVDGVQTKLPLRTAVRVVEQGDELRRTFASPVVLQLPAKVEAGSVPRGTSEGGKP